MKNKSNSSSSSESYFRAQFELACKERDALQGTVEAQEREIDDLKKSVFELSYMLSMQGSAGAGPLSADSASGLTPNLALFDPSVTGHLDHWSLMNEAGMGAGISGGASDRVLVQEAKLLGHTGAVYVAKFAPRDSLVASAGFDRTLMLWEGTYPYTQVACLEGHRQPISDLCWAPDGRSLLSASYDETLAKWDTETGRRVGMLGLEGMINCVQMAAEGGGDGIGGPDGVMGGGGGVGGAGRVAYAGSMNKRIYTVDTRDSMPVVADWSCSSSVNSLHVYSDGSKVMSAEASGKICTWDARTGRMVDEYRLEDPIYITHIQASPPDAGRQDEEGLLLAANCYDNTLRVFHRRFKQNGVVARSSTSTSTPFSTSPANNRSTTTTTTNNNNNYGNASSSSSTSRGSPPSFSDPRHHAAPPSGGAACSSSRSVDGAYGDGGGGEQEVFSGAASGGGTNGWGSGCGLDDRKDQEPPSLQLMRALRGHTVMNFPIRCAFFRGLHHRPPRVRIGVGSTGGGGSGGGGSSGGGGGGARRSSRGAGLGYDDLGKDWQHSLVLATGSGDGTIHIFDISKGQGDEMQTLKGHRSRVYSVDFHPTEPKLVSCSADRTVRIWTPNRKRNSRK